MIDAVRRLLFLMNSHDSFADVIRRYDIDFIARTQRKNRQAREQIESLHHIELRGFRAAAVAHDDGWAKNRARNIGQKLRDHVPAELLESREGNVAEALPIVR